MAGQSADASRVTSSSSSSWLANTNNPNIIPIAADHDIDQRLQRARELLEKSKAKLAAKQAVATMAKENALPFFASTQMTTVLRNGGDSSSSSSSTTTATTTSNGNHRQGVIIKSRNEETGLVLADGEKMAALSEQEEWERRSLLEVFQNENDIFSEASQQLAERDVAASIWNLRKTLQTEDYKRIFDSRNFFIGEDN